MANVNPNQSLLDNPFWRFSLAYWENDAAQKVLLKLQDQFAQDINLLLFSIWFSLSKQQSVDLILEPAVESSDYWQNEVINPLRMVRRALAIDSPVKVSVQKAELEAEQHEQAVLFQLSESLPDAPSQTDDVTLLIENLQCCVNRVGHQDKIIPESLILALVQAAFPALSLETLKHHLKTWSL